MIVGFLYDQPVGKTLEPPKNPHITIKKKFKLNDIDENGLIKLLRGDDVIQGAKFIETDSSEEYGSSENMIITVKNAEDWRRLHDYLMALLAPVSESRDPHFEGDNYLPHITWKLKGEITLDPKPYINKTFEVRYLYLIERVHPTESRAKIIAKIKL